MITNTADTLSRGMAILAENMGIVEAETFIYLVKSEGFDYTKWQRDYFDNKTKEELDAEMDEYFANHPYSGDKTKII
ncbi:MAG: hypothetical protein IJ763_09290 [Lachnospiraceae bacterium]|nr:hypothetical protein [Lachnospiraceae bacterium]